MDDLILHVPGDSVFVHSLAQLHFNFFHAAFRTLESECAPQFFRFAAAETGGEHGHAQQLFLKQRHAECALEHGFERGMRISDALAPLPSL